MFKTWLTCFTKFILGRLWEIFIYFLSQYLIRYGLATIKTVVFLFLSERRISGAARGVGISKVYIHNCFFWRPAISFISQAFPKLVEMCFMSKLWTLYNIYHVPNSVFDCSHLPKRFVVFEDSEKDYLRDYVILEGTMHVLPGFVCFGSNLWWTDVSDVRTSPRLEIVRLVFLLGVILCTRRNCRRALSVSAVLAFFKALFKVSTNLSACPLDLG